jgi:peptidase E
VHDASGMQVGQGSEQRGDSGDDLARSKPRPCAEDIDQAIASDVVKDQCQSVARKRDCIVLTDQMLVVDPRNNVRGAGCLRQCQRHVRHPDDLHDKPAFVMAAHRRPRRPGRARAQLTGDGVTGHERLHGDGDPYSFDMATDSPTILATSGGYRDHDRLRFEFADLLHYAVDLSGASGVVPRVCNVSTASGDDPRFQMDMSEAGREAGFNLTHLSLFSMPNMEDIEGHLMAQDVVWVNGGSVANLLAVWRVHGLDEILRRVWLAGVVLAGVSAGSICWFEGGTTDSFGPELRAVRNGLGFLPYANAVHYDSEPGRRPLVHQLVADGTLGTTHCTDDGVGMLYRGTQFVEAVSEQEGNGAYIVTRSGDDVMEERLDTRLLGRRAARTANAATKSVTWQR